MAQAAPGEEPAVFARNAGVVASKVSYVEVLDKDNDWQVLEGMDDNASITTCEFNWCGTHLLMGDNNGRLHLWSFVPLKAKIKMMSMPPNIPRSTSLEVAGEFGAVFTGGASWNNVGKEPVTKNGKGSDTKSRGVGHQGGGCSGWTTVCVNWSKCSKYAIAAYSHKRKALSDGREPPLPGLVVLWNIMGGVVEGCLRLPSRAGHVSICPGDPRRCTLCCTDGTSYLLDFPARFSDDFKTTPSTFAGAIGDKLVSRMSKGGFSENMESKGGVGRPMASTSQESITSRRSSTLFMSSGCTSRTSTHSEESPMSSATHEMFDKGTRAPSLDKAVDMPINLSTVQSGALSIGMPLAKSSGGWSYHTLLDKTVHEATGIDVDVGGDDSRKVDGVGTKRAAKESTGTIMKTLVDGDSGRHSKLWQQKTSHSNDSVNNAGRGSAHSSFRELFPVAVGHMEKEGGEGPDMRFANTSVSSEGGTSIEAEGAHETLRRDETGEGANARFSPRHEPKVLVPVDISDGELREKRVRGCETPGAHGLVPYTNTREVFVSGSEDIATPNVDIADGIEEGKTATVCMKSGSSGGVQTPGRDSRSNTLGSLSHVSLKNTTRLKGLMSTEIAARTVRVRRRVKIFTLWDPAQPFGQFNTVNDQNVANLPTAEGSTLCPVSTDDSVAHGILQGKVAGKITPTSGQDQHDGSTDGSSIGTSGGLENDQRTRPVRLYGVSQNHGDKASPGSNSTAMTTSSSRSVSPVPSQSSTGGAKARLPVQVGRATWTEDGTILFLLNHEGHLLKLRAMEDGSLSLLSKAELLGGASPATLQLSPEDDWILVATAMKGLCLIPTNDLDIERSIMYGETFGIRGSKTRFWGSATIADIHARGRLDKPGENLTIIGNPAKTRDERTDLFFFDKKGGQPERVCVPRREGVVCVSTSRLRPIIAFVCPTGMLYYREQILKTDFPGPWYPSGYILIDNNVEYQEAEDELDTVVTKTSNGEITSHTQKHEVVVPWQHEVVLVEADASTTDGAGAVVVDTEGAHEPVWPRALPAKIRWIPLEDNLKAYKRACEEGDSEPRCGSQDGFVGPVSRKLSATSSLLTEARRKRGRGSKEGMDWQAKRRRFVSGFYRSLAEKEKRLAEEAAKKRRRADEARQRKQAAKEAAARAARAAASREAAERNFRDEMERLEKENAATRINGEAHPKQVEVKTQDDAKAHERINLRLMVNPHTREVSGAGCAGDPIRYPFFMDGPGPTSIGIEFEVHSHPSKTSGPPMSLSPMGSPGVTNTGSRGLALLPTPGPRSPETLPADGMQSPDEVKERRQEHRHDLGDVGISHVTHLPHHGIRVPGAAIVPSILPGAHSGGTWMSPCPVTQSGVEEGGLRGVGREKVTPNSGIGGTSDGEVLSDRIALGRWSLSGKSADASRGSKGARRDSSVSVAAATGASFSTSSSSTSTVLPSTPEGSRSLISTEISSNQVSSRNGRDPSRGKSIPLSGGENTNDKLTRHKEQLATEDRLPTESSMSATQDKHQLAHSQKSTIIRSSQVHAWGSVEPTEATFSPKCSTGGTSTSEGVLEDLAFCIAPGPDETIFLSSSAGSSYGHGWLGNAGTLGGVGSSPVSGTWGGVGVSAAVGLGSPRNNMSGNSCMEQRGTMRNVIRTPGGVPGTPVSGLSMDLASYSDPKRSDHHGNHLEVTAVATTGGRGDAGRVTGGTGGVGHQSKQSWAWTTCGRATVSSGDSVDLASGYSRSVKSTASPMRSGLRSGYTMPPTSQHGSQTLSPSAKDQFQPLPSFAPLEQSNVMAGAPPLPLPSGAFRGVNMFTEAVTEEGGASVKEYIPSQHTSTTPAAAIGLSQHHEEDSRWGAAMCDP